jgi:group I intron endonuclease
MKISGIYKIESRIKPERIYIGSSVNISKRWCYHKEDLCKNKHHSKKLQRHYNKYGKEDLIFSVIIGCEKEDLIHTEQFFIDSYLPYFNNNIKANSRLGIKASLESKLKMSISAKKRGYSQIAILKMAEANRGKKGGMHGLCHSEETKQKMSKIAKGKRKSIEHAQHIKESWVIRKLKIK